MADFHRNVLRLALSMPQSPLFHFRDPIVSDRTILAGAKAPEDIRRIVAEMGFRELSLIRLTGQNPAIRILSGVLRLFDAVIRAFRVPRGTRFFVQFPGDFTCSPTNLVFLRLCRRLHGTRLVVLVHDVDAARGWAPDDGGGLEWEMRSLLSEADAVITHNEVMSDWLAARGVDRAKLVGLGIFDYLADGFAPDPTPSFDRSATIAGNLGLDKSSYLATIGDITDVKWNLYGMKFDPERISGSTVSFHGLFPAEEIPRHLTEGFGLVWDGDSPDTCAGGTGEYLRINNPHKLSLFLAAGLPVAIWKEAAEADFVLRNGVGIAVGSLSELGRRISETTPEQYAAFKRNAIALSAKLRSGHFTKTAIQKALALNP